MHDDSAARFLDAGGTRLCYRDDGAGPAVVLIHGWLLDSTVWRTQAVALSPHFRVLRLDRRGFGQSAGPPDLAADTGDVLHLLDHLGIARAAVLGMSQGARIAIGVARAAPSRIAALVIDGAPALPGLPAHDWRQETPIDEYRQLLRTQGIAALRAALAANPLLQLRTRDAGARSAIAGMLERYTGADLLAPSGTVIDVGADDLAALAVPVLVLNGALDSPQRLRVGELLQRLTPGAERRTVPAGGHLACLDDPANYNAILLEFLSRHSHQWA